MLSFKQGFTRLEGEGKANLSLEIIFHLFCGDFITLPGKLIVFHEKVIIL